MENKFPVVSSDPFCPVADCTECEIKPCPFDRQRSEQLMRQQHREQLTAGLEALYTQQRAAMEHTEELLRMVRIHD